MPPPDPTRAFPPDATRTGTPLDPDLTPSAPGVADTAPTPPRRPADPVVPTIPGYELLRLLGEGGMGAVWEARQVKLNRLAAVKLVLGGRAVGQRELIRFLAEAEAVAAVKHPHVVQVYEYGESDGRPYLAMEHLPGGSLADRLKRDGRLPPREAAALLGKVARGVQAAHDRQIVHRDLKPANVLFDEAGEPRVTDFGLAKRGGGADLTQTGAVFGTPAYMAPEQAGGKTKFAGPPADVWALGVVLYECLTGRKPFAGASVESLLLSVMVDDPRPPRKLVPGVPRDLELICLKCLAKDPLERYPTAGELADDLGRFATGEPLSVRAAGPIERAAKWMRRKPTLAAAYTLTVVAVLLTGVTAGAVWLWQRAEHNWYDAVTARDQLAEQKELIEQARKGEALARGQADAARKVADGLRKEAEAAREKVEVIEYGRVIQLAHQAWRENNLTRARDLLAGTDARQRGWEWWYVHRLCHADLVTLSGHTGLVHSAEFSPDGLLVATGSIDGMARVWDARTGDPVVTLKGHTGAVCSAKFNQAGDRLVTASHDGTARVWDVRTGSQLSTLKGHRGMVWSAVFSPDGARVLTTWSDDGTSRVWDAASGDELWSVRLSKDIGSSAAFSPDGSRVASPWDNSARVWDAKTGTPIATFGKHTDRVHSVTFFPRGTRIATASVDGTTRVWEVETGAEVCVLNRRTLKKAVVSPGGTRIVAIFDDKPWDTPCVWNAETGAELFQLRGHSGHVDTIAFSPDGTRMVTASSDRTARVWDTATGVAVATLKGHTGDVRTATFSPDGHRVVTASEDGTARVWDLVARAETVSLWQHESPPPPAMFRAENRDGTRTVYSTVRNTAELWNPKSRVATLAGHTGDVYSVAFSPDGDRVATASLDKTARVWDAATGAAVATLKGHEGGVHTAVFSPDGRRVVTASRDKTARVWDAVTGAELIVLRHEDDVSAAGFSRDGARILTTTTFSRLNAHVWDSSPINMAFRPKELAPPPRPAR